MKQAKKNKLLLAIIIVVAVSAGAVAGLPALKQQLAPKVPQTPLAAGPGPDKDLEILQELGGLFHRLDSVRDFEVRGSVSSTDPADSAANGTIAYHYARLDSMVYYRLGQEEILSTKEAFVMVNHSAEQVFVSGPKPFNPGVFPAGDQMANFLTGEGYAISREKKDGLTWITLVRPNHVTCKEYRVGYDDNGFIRETFMRLTDLRDPLNAEKDRTVKTKADGWKTERPAASLFDASRFVQQQSGRYVPAGSLKTYQLILTQ